MIRILHALLVGTILLVAFAGNALALECTQDSDCKKGFYCIVGAGICKAMTCPSSCATDADCRFCDNQRVRCEPKLKHCVAIPKGTPCLTDAQCRVGEICDPSGHCVIPKRPCKKDSDCSFGQSCGSQGHCITTPLRKCVGDSDCFPGESCPKGTCYRPPTTCRKDVDCDGGQVCASNGVCQNPPRPRCSSDKDCPTGEYCNPKQYCDFKFVGCPATCRVDQDCQRCPAGNIRCLPSKGVCAKPIKCNADSDCKPLQRCDAKGLCALKAPLEPRAEPTPEPAKEVAKEPKAEPDREPRPVTEPNESLRDETVVTSEPGGEFGKSDAGNPEVSETIRESRKVVEDPGLKDSRTIPEVSGQQGCSCRTAGGQERLLFFWSLCLLVFFGRGFRLRKRR